MMYGPPPPAPAQPQPDPEEYDLSEPGDDGLFAFRLERLRRDGFRDPDAEHLARARISPSVVEALLKRGCDHATAYRIVIP